MEFDVQVILHNLAQKDAALASNSAKCVRLSI